MSPDTYLVSIFYAVLIFLGLLGLAIAIQVFRKRLSWGAARRMGVPMTIFIWMNAIYGLVLFEGAYGLVSIILELPLWIDILIFVVILAITMAVYFRLLHRNKFKPTLFTALFLVPLSVPGIHTTGKVLQNTAPTVILKRSESARSTSAFPQKIEVQDSGYGIEFPDTHSKGTFGDALTAAQLKRAGYMEVPSKITQIKGIDGVYLRHNNKGEMKEILVIENKVDSSTLAKDQMTDEWVKNNVTLMLAHPNEAVRHTGQLIRDNPNLVRKQLWHHNLSSGETRISSLDRDATKSLVRTESGLGKKVRDVCQTNDPDFTCFSTKRSMFQVIRAFLGSG